MKLLRSSLLLATFASVLGACSASVGPGSDSNGGGPGAGGSAAGTGGSGGAAMAGRDGAGTGGGGSAGMVESGAAGRGGEQSSFTLTSPAFVEMGALGGQYQCGATGVSPPLNWTAGPAGTQSYAVVLAGPNGTDPGNPYHWVIWDIPAATTALWEAVAQMAMPPVPAGSEQTSPGTDGATWPGYSGPCSTLTTVYTFSVYALDVSVLPGVTPSATGAEVFAAIQASAIASAKLTATATHYHS